LDGISLIIKKSVVNSIVILRRTAGSLTVILGNVILLQSQFFLHLISPDDSVRHVVNVSKSVPSMHKRLMLWDLNLAIHIWHFLLCLTLAPPCF